MSTRRFASNILVHRHSLFEQQSAHHPTTAQGGRQTTVTKIENTVRYLGIDVEDALALAENTEI